MSQISYKQEGNAFGEKVWCVLSTLIYGEIISYKTLAERVGNSKAFRAAGTACGENRLILLVPCHRVVKSDGAIGEYLYGTKIKKFLLEMEACYK